MTPDKSDRDPATRIAETDASPLRVLSGPGTGKTYSLMKKVAYLLRNGANPERILATTFTRTAAEDLKKELEKLNVPLASSVHSTTLHALCFQILNKERVFQATRRVPRPLLDYEKRFLLEDLKYAKLGNVRDLKRQLTAFAAAWARRQQDTAGWPASDIDKQFESHLFDWLKTHRAMLIEELVPVALSYLRNNPECDERKAYSNVLVDEYQDLNVAEQEFIDLISENANLTVIGDENQSIYSFRYAHPEGIVEFDKTHEETTDIPLEDCRRCPANLVKLANTLISHNRQMTERRLRSHPDTGLAEIYIAQWPDLESEASGIAELTKELLQNGEVSPGKILVLAPRRHIGYLIRDALKSRGIAALSFFKEQELDGDPKAMRKSLVQQSFSLLTLKADPEDRVALRCWCGFGSNDLRAGAWTRFVKLCDENSCSLTDGIEGILVGRLKLAHGAHFKKRLKELRDCLGNLSRLSGRELFDKLFPESDPEFSQIRDAIVDFINENDDAESILERLRSSITQPELPTNVDFVRVMSLHKSKGLTAQLVVVAGCIQGLLPTLPDVVPEREIREADEEQRRLFYVAITRARRFLVLSSVKCIPIKLAHKMRVPIHKTRDGVTETITSEFIDELGFTRPTPIHGSKLVETLRKCR